MEDAKDVNENMNSQLSLSSFAAFERWRQETKTKNLLKFCNILMLPSDFISLVMWKDNCLLFVFVLKYKTIILE